MRQSGHQATVYLTSNERDRFEAYARRFFLDAAGLLALLFARELRVGRLRKLVATDKAPDGSRKPKITARLRPDDHAALIKMAQAADVSLSYIGAVLVRDELANQWLENAVTTLSESRCG